MARRKNQPEAVRIKYDLAERLRSIRTELYGERGGPDLARRLGVPIRTWYNYESGVTVPSEVVLRFIELTAIEPTWLLYGRGNKFRAASAPRQEPAGPTASIRTLLRIVLERLESRPGRPGRGSTELGSYPGGFGISDGTEPSDAVGTDPSWARGDENANCEWLAAQREGRYLRMEGDAMVPIISDEAFVAYSDGDEDGRALEGRLVVAWVEGQPLVRWFERSGRYALLRAENPAYEPGMTLLDMQADPEHRRVRRILWIGTNHH